MSFKIATWNVNSLRVRLPHILMWLEKNNPSILALQETKVVDLDFPIEAFTQIGYECIFSGQKTYNGVAILSRKKGCDTVTDIPELNDAQRRVLAATIDGVRVLNLYIPNGESVGSEKYHYKLNWLKHLDRYLKEAKQSNSQFIILGDFNIAPEERDVHDPMLWQDRVLVSEPERQAFRDILQLGFHDCFRLKEQPENSFSWWDYRLNGFKRNLGLRIDHILANVDFAKKCVNCYIDSIPRGWERPSDHAPVIAEFDWA